MARRWSALGWWIGILACAPGAFAAPGAPPAVPEPRAADSDSVADRADRTDPRQRLADPAPRVIPLPEEVVRGEGVTFGEGGFQFQVPAREAARMPGGFTDPTRYLQALPGVSNDSDFDGLLYVRGGDGGQNRILVDQINVSDPYHFSGVVSVLNVDVIDRLEFTPGGYTAENGDALAGMIQVRRRIGNPAEFHGSGSVNPLAANFVLEGPLARDAKASWLVAGRRSVVDKILKGRADAPTALPAYWDMDGRLWRRFGANDLRLGFLRSGDFLSARVSDTFKFAPAESSGLEWNRRLTLGTLNWERTAGPWALTQALAYGWRAQELSLFGSLPQNARAKTRQFDWRADAKRPAVGLRWASGVQVSHSHSDYDLNINRLSILEPDRRSNPRTPLDTAQVVARYEARNVYLAGYVQSEASLLDSTLTVTLGARAEFGSRNDAFEPTPRLRVLWRTPWTGWSVSGAAGSYRQFPADRLEADPVIGNPGLEAERADHLSLGVSRALTRGGRVSLEGYSRRLSRLIVFDSNAGDGQPPFVSAGTGWARGLEFLAHVPRARWDGWVAYTLGRVTYRDFPDHAEYAPAQDIRHTVSVVGRVRPDEHWSVGVKWRAQSGRPYTPVTGREDVSDLIDGIQWLPVLGEFNSGRFPWYERLDVRVERAFRISGARVSAAAELVNALGRRNLYDYRYVDGYGRAQTVTMLPMLPTLGITAAF